MELKDLGALATILAPLLLSFAGVVIAAKVLQFQVSSEHVVPTPNVQEEFAKAWQAARMQDAVTENLILAELKSMNEKLQWLMNHHS